MDDLAYHYYTSSGGTYTMTATGGAPVNGTNKLAYVDDAGTAGNYTDDLEDQSAGNYEYDEIGNLTKDVSEGIDEITWNVYGKIETITRVTGWSVPGSSPAVYPSNLEFIYDAFGNRIVKIVKPNGALGELGQRYWEYTYYMRDASGNVMSTYKRTWAEISGTVEEDNLALIETHLYGGSRLGIKDRESEALFSKIRYNYSGMNGDGSYATTTIAASTFMNVPDLSTPERYLGYKQFEFSNHLGNVLVTLSDRKTQVNNAGSIDYFMADVRSYSDYSAFGVALAGRAGGTYRYNFNGKEKDNETSTYDYGFRIYNARLGRFLSVDPLFKSYPELTTYQFASNTPIQAIDLDGLEAAKKTVTPGSAAKRASAQGTNIKPKAVAQPKVAAVPPAITNRKADVPVATAQNNNPTNQGANKPTDAPPQATAFIANHDATTAQAPTSTDSTNPADPQVTGNYTCTTTDQQGSVTTQTITIVETKEQETYGGYDGVNDKGDGDGVAEKTWGMPDDGMGGRDKSRSSSVGGGRNSVGEDIPYVDYDDDDIPINDPDKIPEGDTFIKEVLGAGYDAKTDTRWSKCLYVKDSTELDGDRSVKENGYVRATPGDAQRLVNENNRADD